MTVTFYTCNDAVNSMPKTMKNGVIISNVQPYSPCSVLSPSILLSNGNVNPKTHTHMYIAEYQRYYNITEIEQIEGNRCIVSGSVDVLATYGSNLLNTTQYIVRTADSSAEESIVPDPKQPTTDYYLVDDFPYLTDVGDVGNGVDNYILSTLGGSGGKSPEHIDDWYDWTEKFRKDSEDSGTD